MKKQLYLLAALLLTAFSATAQENHDPLSMSPFDNETKTKAAETRPFWVDTIVSQPESFVMDAEGNVEISSADGLVWLISAVNGLNGCEPDDFDGRTVRLTNDIDFREKGMEYRFTPIGTRETPFLGTFDGNGHKINRLLHNYSRFGPPYHFFFDMGIFGYIRHATVRNLTLDSSCRICSSAQDSAYYRGAVVGFADSLSVIENCHIHSWGLMHDSGGGLVGMNRNSTVRNCSCIDYCGAPTEGAAIVAYNRSEGGYADAVVENCYFHGRWSYHFDTFYAAGLVCFNETVPNDNGKRAVIRNCHSTPTRDFMAYSAFGTIAAVNGEGSLIEKCYSDPTLMYYKCLVGINKGEIIDCIGYNNSTGLAVLDRPVSFGEMETDLLKNALNLWIAEQEQPERYRTWAVFNDSVPEFAGYYIGIPESDGTAQPVTLCPNPASDLVAISGVETAQAEVFNLFGQLVMTVHHSNLIRTEDLPQGLYLIRITSPDGKAYIAKVIIK